MPDVECITLDGRTKRIPDDRLTFRPAAYAIILSGGKVLLLRMRSTGKYHLPGGGIHIGERLTDALMREVREETGIEIGRARFAYFEELFFYYDPSEKAYHGLHFFFACGAKSLRLLPDEGVSDGSAEQPRWVKVEDLTPEDFQIHGGAVLRYCKKAAARAAGRAGGPVRNRKPVKKPRR